jgi:DNA-binding transcriptional MerR regulator
LALNIPASVAIGAAMNKTNDRLSIGCLAEKTGLTSATIRHYEHIGLISGSDNREQRHKRYRADDVPRLIFIRQCRETGFPIEQIRLFLKSAQGEDPSVGDPVATVHSIVLETRARLAKLRALERSVHDYLGTLGGGDAKRA